MSSNPVSDHPPRVVPARDVSSGRIRTVTATHEDAAVRESRAGIWQVSNLARLIPGPLRSSGTQEGLVRRVERSGVKEFSYIVVGAGTAGCVIAARLSMVAEARVLLLEAGGTERTRAMTVPNAWPDNLGSAADWADVTMPQAEAGPVAYPRGRALGGSGAINAMAHVRGHRAVYDRWASEGAAGWSFAELLPYFRRSERTIGRDEELRGTTGPIPVSPTATGGRHPVACAFAEALLQAGCEATDDLSGTRQEGVAWVDLAISNTERVCSADAYLRRVLNRRNLVVETDCLVTRLKVEHGRCTGVSYVRGGVSVQARAADEVIVCAGAVGSPQLLMLSGIGPAGELRALGIEPVADVPAVGQNLQDHPIAMAYYACPVSLPPSLYNHGEAYAALRSGLAGTYPDLHLFPILLPLAPVGCRPPTTGYALVAAVVAPDSRGSVRLASADPRRAPLIDPGFLREPQDLDRLVEGLGLVRQAAASNLFAGLRAAEAWPGAGLGARAGLRSWTRRTVASYYHPGGTCRMGSGAASVVDSQLRVRGVAGLRVADASVMPVIPNAHPNATVLAIAERAAELIRGPLAAPA
jgi:choline dehydrogenase